MAEIQPLEILHNYGITGAGIRLERLSQGYINDTFRVYIPNADGYILQRVNGTVFPKQEWLMENLERVLPFLEGPGYRALELLKNSEGLRSHRDAGGSLWRIFKFIPGSASYEDPETPEMAREAGRIVAAFHTLASEIPPGAMHIPLPGFHDIHGRYGQLQAVLPNAGAERLAKSGALAEQAESLFGFCQDIPFSELPIRVCHNDTKLSNILFDKNTGKALCLIDLDTLMPGHLLYDFGDAARKMLHPGSETAKSLFEAPADLQFFEAFVQGWKESGLKMQELEEQWLCHGVVLMPALHGIRALTDYLAGDQYYKVAYPEQNLDRARQLLGAAESARKALGRMQELTEKLWG